MKKAAGPINKIEKMTHFGTSETQQAEAAMYSRINLNPLSRWCLPEKLMPFCTLLRVTICFPSLKTSGSQHSSILIGG